MYERAGEFTFDPVFNLTASCESALTYIDGHEGVLLGAATLSEFEEIILSAIGFLTTMFSALFAVARTVDRVALSNEVISDPGQKIGRVRELYNGLRERDYLPLDGRQPARIA